MELDKELEVRCALQTYVLVYARSLVSEFTDNIRSLVLTLYLLCTHIVLTLYTYVYFVVQTVHMHPIVLPVCLHVCSLVTSAYYVLGVCTR